VVNEVKCVGAGRSPLCPVSGHSEGHTTLFLIIHHGVLE
jgi:hypothetical protein